MNRICFLISHFGSDSDYFLNALNSHPRIEIQNFNANYSHPDDLFSLLNLPHKTRNISAIYGDHLLSNTCLSNKVFYNICNFIYVIRSAKPTLNKLLSYGYSEETAYNYYIFRLRRIFEMAKRTPGAILFTWDDLITENAFTLVKNYFSLQDKIYGNIFNEVLIEKASLKTIEKAEDCYEKYLFKMKQFPLITLPKFLERN